MTNQQMEHVEKKLIKAIDTIVYDMEKRTANPAVIAALPEIVFALSRIHEL